LYLDQPSVPDDITPGTISVLMMPASAFSVFRFAFPRILLFSYLNTLRKALSDCQTCLDIGCGPASPVTALGFRYSLGVEGYPALLDEARKNNTHNDYLLARAQDIGKQFETGAFDCCVALDLIEHLTREEGLELIRQMERIASKRIAIFTPNGYLPQKSREGDLQEHLSGWDASTMRGLGFMVIGMHGLKALRGEEHKHRFRPHALSGVVSAISHYGFTMRLPELAAAILCVKSVEQKQGLEVRDRGSGTGH
jgi:hypothetical protein